MLNEIITGLVVILIELALFLLVAVVFYWLGAKTNGLLWNIRQNKKDTKRNTKKIARIDAKLDRLESNNAEILAVLGKIAPKDGAVESNSAQKG